MYSEIPPANGLIIHPGAVGDCLLALPLAEYMKKTLNLHRLDFVGRMEYIGFYPGRTCIDRIRSLESIQMHRLFQDESSFVLEDKDRLQVIFEGYEQIVSFLGYGHPYFENNLLFTVHSTHSAEVTLLPLAPGKDDRRHVSEFYLESFCRQAQLEAAPFEPLETIRPLPSDFSAGQDLLDRLNINAQQPLVVIQPGSGSVQKSWSLQNFVQTATNLKKEGVQVAFLLGPADLDIFSPDVLIALTRQWPVLSELSLTEVLQVLTQMDVFLGNDSGIGHLAAALGKPTIVVFGPASDPAHYRPLGKRVTVLQPDPESFAEPAAAESARTTAEVIKHL